MVTHSDLVAPVNPLGLQRSPYGELLAIAMQSPVDTYFHAAQGEDHGDHDHDHDTCGHSGCDHDHDEDHEGHDHDDTAPAPQPPSTRPLQKRMIAFLDDIGKGVNARTNPLPPTPSHQFYLRRKAEDKLRFAYQLDPANYSNFANYYFFLTVPTLGTRPELTPGAVTLAQKTVDYCMTRTDDPRSALTAAAAVENILEQMLTSAEAGVAKPDPTALRGNLHLLDQCLERYRELAGQWDTSGNWKRLSPDRLEEARQAAQFVSKVREAQAVAVERWSAGNTAHQATN